MGHSHSLKVVKIPPEWVPVWVRNHTVFQCQGCEQYMVYVGDGDWREIFEPKLADDDGIVSV